MQQADDICGMAPRPISNFAVRTEPMCIWRISLKKYLVLERKWGDFVSLWRVTKYYSEDLGLSRAKAFFKGRGILQFLVASVILPYNNKLQGIYCGGAIYRARIQKFYCATHAKYTQNNHRK